MRLGKFFLKKMHFFLAWKVFFVQYVSTSSGYSLMVKLQPSKLITRVRFPLPAPTLIPIKMKTSLLPARIFAGAFFALVSFAVVNAGDAPKPVAKTKLAKSTQAATDIKALKPEELYSYVGKEVENCPSCAPEVVKSVIDSVGITSPLLPGVLRAAVRSHPDPVVCYDVVVRAVGEKFLGVDAESFLDRAAISDPRTDVKAPAVQAERALYIAPAKEVTPPTPPSPDVSAS